jgi:hypothetical protein
VHSTCRSICLHVYEGSCSAGFARPYLFVQLLPEIKVTTLFSPTRTVRVQYVYNVVQRVTTHVQRCTEVRKYFRTFESTFESIEYFRTSVLLYKRYDTYFRNNLLYTYVYVKLFSMIWKYDVAVCMNHYLLFIVHVQYVYTYVYCNGCSVQLYT